MASRADDKCGSCYTQLRKGPTVLDPNIIKIVLCDDCYGKWEREEDINLPTVPLTESLEYGTI